MNKLCVVLIWTCLFQTAGAQSLPLPQATTLTHSAFSAAGVTVQSLHIHNNGTQAVELVCPRKGPAQSRPATAPAEPTDIPDAQDVEQALQETQTSSGQRLAPSPHVGAIRQDKTAPLRMAIWGDSHMAAAFFSDHMLRQLTGHAGPSPLTVSSRFVNAGVGHGGVRALVRKTCLTGEWAREMAYAHSDAAAAPGPGMTSLLAKQPGATLTLDLRDGSGTARLTRLQILHHGAASGRTRLGIRVDGEAETELSLTGQAGPNALELTTATPLSILQIRVIEGSFRFQGLKWAPSPTPTAIHLDLFAYPGATVGGWARSDLAYLASWFTDQPYDLALIAFGTNEGNDPRFNETT